MMPLAGAPIEVIPEGYFLVGGMVLQVTGAHSTAPVDITVPYADKDQDLAYFRLCRGLGNGCPAG